jgi:hypothetical protein
LSRSVGKELPRLSPEERGSHVDAAVTLSVCVRKILGSNLVGITSFIDCFVEPCTVWFRG